LSAHGETRRTEPRGLSNANVRRSTIEFRWGPDFALKAIRASDLGSWPQETLDRLIATAVHWELPAGRSFCRSGMRPPVGVVVSGLLRCFLVSVDGRQVTVSYVRTGGLIGFAELLMGEPSHFDVEVVNDACILRINASTIEQVLRTQPELGLTLVRHVGRTALAYLAELRVTAFGNVRARVIRHLLTLGGMLDTRGPLLLSRSSNWQMQSDRSGRSWPEPYAIFVWQDSSSLRAAAFASSTGIDSNARKSCLCDIAIPLRSRAADHLPNLHGNIRRRELIDLIFVKGVLTHSDPRAGRRSAPRLLGHGSGAVSSAGAEGVPAGYGHLTPDGWEF
jgi:CRP-like cAMP-binding protein